MTNRKTRTAKDLKDLQARLVEAQREHAELKMQMEPLQDVLASIPYRPEDCTQEQWAYRNQTRDELSKLERKATPCSQEITRLQRDTHDLSLLLNAVKEIAASTQREQELMLEVERLSASAERVRNSMADTQANHATAARATEQALQQAAQARAKATALGDSKAGAIADQAVQEATIASQQAKQAQDRDAPLIEALLAQAQAIESQIQQAHDEQEAAREQIRRSRIALFEDEWDQKAQELVRIGNQLVNLGRRGVLHDLKIPRLADVGRSILYSDLLDDSSVQQG
ncbi:MAG: hypothetical protein ACRES5_10515 [Pseudomonas sp.]